MSKISQYGPLSIPQEGDLLPVVDVDDPTEASSGTTKSITVADLFNYGNFGSPVNANWDFETGSSPWTGGNGATVIQSSTWAWHGSNSLRMTGNGSTANPQALSELTVPVTPSTAYSVAAMTYSTINTQMTLDVDWYTSGHTYISTSSGTSINVNQVTPTQLYNFGLTSPSNAAFCQIYAVVTGTPANTAHFYYDDFALLQTPFPLYGYALRSDGVRTILSPLTGNDINGGTPSFSQIVVETNAYITNQNIYGTFLTANIKTVTSNYTISISTDYFIVGDATGGPFTITLPDATTCAGQLFFIESINAGGSNVVHVATTGGQTIAGVSSITLTGVFQGVQLISNGSNWYVTSAAGYAPSFAVDNLSVGNCAIFTGLNMNGSLAALSGGTDTSGTATASSPTFVSGTALQVNATQDTMLYIAVKTSASLTVAIGSTSAASTNILPAESAALGLLTLRVPKGWYVKLTGTMADLQITAVTC